MAYSTARGSDALAAKGALHARLWRGGDAPQGDQLDLFVTHLQANHPDIRKAQIAELAAFIRERSDPALPAILLGDLNIDGSAIARRDPRAEYHHMLRELAALGFRDPGQALGGTDSWQRRRIDYMLLRSGQLSVADLRTEQFHDLLVRALSDHAALTAELRLAARAKPHRRPVNRRAFASKTARLRERETWKPQCLPVERQGAGAAGSGAERPDEGVRERAVAVP